MVPLPGVPSVPLALAPKAAAAAPSGRVKNAVRQDFFEVDPVERSEPPAPSAPPARAVAAPATATAAAATAALPPSAVPLVPFMQPYAEPKPVATVAPAFDAAYHSRPWASRSATSSLLMVVGHMRQYEHMEAYHRVMLRQLTNMLGEAPTVCFVTYASRDHESGRSKCVISPRSYECSMSG
eukprot:COSAG03_NODE_5175_length_1325_cov_2.795269_2_plen_182_part_00